MALHLDTLTFFGWYVACYKSCNSFIFICNTMNIISRWFFYVQVVLYCVTIASYHCTYHHLLSGFRECKYQKDIIKRGILCFSKWLSILWFIKVTSGTVQVQMMLMHVLLMLNYTAVLTNFTDRQKTNVLLYNM